MKDIGKSVKNKLNNIAKNTSRQHADLLQYYAMERFLYRLSVSPHRDKFLLKGALLLQSVDHNLARATKDIDFIATFLARENQVISMLVDCIKSPVQTMAYLLTQTTLTSLKFNEMPGIAGFASPSKAK